MRTRLAGGFAAITALFCLGAAAPDPDGFVRVPAGEIKWLELPHTHGVKAALLFGDLARPGPYVIRVRFPPHIMDRPHTHSGGDRYVTVLEGTWYTGTGPVFDPAKAVPLGPGSVMKHPSGAVHWDGSGSDAAVVVQITGTGPVKTVPVDPNAPEWVDISTLPGKR